MLRQTLPGPCAFCLGTCPPGAPWCPACLKALPWNRHACRQCAEPLPEHAAPLCGHCLKAPPAFGEARVALRYEHEVAALVHRFKFSAEPRAGTLLVALMVESLVGLERADMPTLLVALPRHRQRAREAGFDTAPWLAARLSRQLGIPWYCARRVKATPTQRGLDRRARQRNLRGAFAVDRRLPAHVALVDDVMTTGASLDALARVCRDAGAQRIEAWAAARTPLIG
ncbi:ComF family protein [Modicisalibacter coralii]|uniref:ComF family protein n=1 Tax=Modicisalibacter coralii TaxID=2304602 RepID=UPI001F2E8C77|nr:ComF family protein [Halomonas coralii]